MTMSGLPFNILAAELEIFGYSRLREEVVEELPTIDNWQQDKVMISTDIDDDPMLTPVAHLEDRLLWHDEDDLVDQNTVDLTVVGVLVDEYGDIVPDVELYRFTQRVARNNAVTIEAMNIANHYLAPGQNSSVYVPVADLGNAHTIEIGYVSLAIGVTIRLVDYSGMNLLDEYIVPAIYGENFVHPAPDMPGFTFYRVDGLTLDGPTSTITSNSMFGFIEKVDGDSVITFLYRPITGNVVYRFIEETPNGDRIVKQVQRQIDETSFTFNIFNIFLNSSTPEYEPEGYMYLGVRPGTGSVVAGAFATVNVPSSGVVYVDLLVMRSPIDVTVRAVYHNSGNIMRDTNGLPVENTYRVSGGEWFTANLPSNFNPLYRTIDNIITRRMILPLGHSINIRNLTITFYMMPIHGVINVSLLYKYVDDDGHYISSRLIGTQNIRTLTDIDVRVFAPNLETLGYTLTSHRPSGTPGVPGIPGVPQLDYIDASVPDAIRFYYHHHEPAFSHFQVELRHNTTGDLLPANVQPSVVYTLVGTPIHIRAPHVQGFELTRTEHLAEGRNPSVAGNGHLFIKESAPRLPTEMPMLGSHANPIRVVFYYTPIYDVIEEFTVPVTVMGRGGGNTLYTYSKRVPMNNEFIIRSLNPANWTYVNVEVVGGTRSEVRAMTEDGDPLYDDYGDSVYVVGEYRIEALEAPITIIFNYRTDEKTVRINLISEDGETTRTTIASFNETAIVGQAFSIRAPHIEHYEFIRTEIGSGYSTTIENEGYVYATITPTEDGTYEITFVYRRMTGNVVVRFYEENYYGENDHRLIAQRSATHNHGTPLTLELGTLPTSLSWDWTENHYTPVRPASTHMVTVSGQVTIVHFYFTKDVADVRVIYYNVLTGEVIDSSRVISDERIGETIQVTATPREDFIPAHGTQNPASVLVRPMIEVDESPPRIGTEHRFGLMPTTRAAVTINLNYGLPTIDDGNGTQIANPNHRTLGTQVISSVTGTEVRINATDLTPAGYRFVGFLENGEIVEVEYEDYNYGLIYVTATTLTVRTPSIVEVIFERDPDAFVDVIVTLVGRRLDETITEPTFERTEKITVLRYSDVRIFAPSIAGYILREAPAQPNPVIIDRIAEDKPIRFYYTPIYDVIEEFTVPVTVTGRGGGNTLYTYSKRVPMNNEFIIRSLSPANWTYVNVEVEGGTRSEVRAMTEDGDPLYDDYGDPVYVVGEYRIGALEAPITIIFNYMTNVRMVTINMVNGEGDAIVPNFEVPGILGQSFIKRAPHIEHHAFVRATPALTETNGDVVDFYGRIIIENTGNSITFVYEPIRGNVVIVLNELLVDDYGNIVEDTYENPIVYRTIGQRSVVREFGSNEPININDVWNNFALSHYTLVGSATQSPKIGYDPVTITFNFTKNRTYITVIYIDALTGEEVSKKVEDGEGNPILISTRRTIPNVRLGEQREIIADVPTGYKLADPATSRVLLHVLPNAREHTFVVMPTTYNDVVINLIYGNTLQGVLIERLVIRGITGTVMTIEAQDLSARGYVLSGASLGTTAMQLGVDSFEVAIGTHNSVNFFYETDPELFYHFVIIMLDEEGEEISHPASGTIISILRGISQSLFAPNVPQYVLDTSLSGNTHIRMLGQANYVPNGPGLQNAMDVVFRYSPAEALVILTVRDVLEGTDIYHERTIRVLPNFTGNIAALNTGNFAGTRITNIEVTPEVDYIAMLSTHVVTLQNIITNATIIFTHAPAIGTHLTINFVDYDIVSDIAFDLDTWTDAIILIRQIENITPGHFLYAIPNEVEISRFDTRGYHEFRERYGWLLHHDSDNVQVDIVEYLTETPRRSVVLNITDGDNTIWVGYVRRPAIMANVTVVFEGAPVDPIETEDLYVGTGYHIDWNEVMARIPTDFVVTNVTESLNVLVEEGGTTIIVRLVPKSEIAGIIHQTLRTSTGEERHLGTMLIPAGLDHLIIQALELALRIAPFEISEDEVIIDEVPQDGAIGDEVIEDEAIEDEISENLVELIEMAQLNPTEFLTSVLMGTLMPMSLSLLTGDQALDFINEFVRLLRVIGEIELANFIEIYFLIEHINIFMDTNVYVDDDGFTTINIIFVERELVTLDFTILSSIPGIAPELIPTHSFPILFGTIVGEREIMSHALSTAQVREISMARGLNLINYHAYRVEIDLETNTAIIFYRNAVDYMVGNGNGGEDGELYTYMDAVVVAVHQDTRQRSQENELPIPIQTTPVTPISRDDLIKFLINENWSLGEISTQNAPQLQVGARIFEFTGIFATVEGGSRIEIDGLIGEAFELLSYLNAIIEFEFEYVSTPSSPGTPPIPPTPQPPIWNPPVQDPTPTPPTGPWFLGHAVRPPEERPEEDSSVEFEHHYVIGFRDGTFRPENGITRAEMAQMFFRLSSNNAGRFGQSFTGFADVNETGWYFEAISYFANQGILVGFPDGTFRPNQEITNAEFAQFAAGVFALAPAMQLDYITGHWSAEAVNATFNQTIFNYFPSNYTFERDNILTRAEAVTTINYHLNRNSHRASIHGYLNGRQVYTDVTPNYWAFYQIMEASIDHFFIRDNMRIKTWLTPELNGWLRN